MRKASLGRRPIIAICVALLSPGLARAQSYPSRPITFIVPFGAGGVADITARVLAQRLGETIGQQVVAENRPSAGGIVAAEAVAKSDPDGYTLLLGSNGTAVSASLFRALPYDTLRDFAGVSTAGFFDIAVLVNADSAIGSVRELVAAARSHPDRVSMASVNIATPSLFRTTTSCVPT